MTTNYHVPIVLGAPGTPTTFNTPLSALDTELTDQAADLLNLQQQFGMFTVAGGNIATKANGAAAAAQKVVVVDSTTGFLAGAYVVYDRDGANGLEYNTIDTIDSPTQLTMLTNLGTGGIADNAVVSMIGPSEYLAAHAPYYDSQNAYTLDQAMLHASGKVYNVERYKRAAEAHYSYALQRIVDTAPTGSTLFIPAGTYSLLGTLSGGVYYGVDLVTRTDLAIVGAGSRVTTLQYTDADPFTFFVEEAGAVARLTFKGLTLVNNGDQPGDFTAATGMRIRAFTDLTIEDCHFQAHAQGALVCGWGGTSSGLRFRHNTMTGDSIVSGVGVLIANSATVTDVDISGNSFAKVARPISIELDNNTGAAAVSGVRVTNNYITTGDCAAISATNSYCGVHLVVDDATSTLSNVVIANNVFVNNRMTTGGGSSADILAFAEAGGNIRGVVVTGNMSSGYGDAINASQYGMWFAAYTAGVFDSLTVCNNIMRLPVQATAIGMKFSTVTNPVVYANTILTGASQYASAYELGTTTPVLNVQGNTTGTWTGELEAADGYRQTIDGWYTDAVGADQAITAMSRLAASGEPTRWIAPRAGSITGVQIYSTAARVAGTATITINIGGAPLAGPAAVLDGTAGHTDRYTANYAKDTYAFALGDKIELMLTTVGWNPAGAHIRGALEVET